MKPDITPTQHEISLPEGEFIVSKSDLKGRFTYVNRVFMQIAGYSEKQLLGQQHNIVRHPDMPRGAFRLLWQTLQQGQEFFAYVKNLSADGSFYWVFANITPDYDENGKLQGYYSVRRKPRPEALETVEPIYAEMLAVEKRSSAKDAPDASMAYLQNLLDRQNVDYEHFVLSL